MRKMVRDALLFGLALCLCCLPATRAGADEAQEDDSGFYIEAGASVYVIELPDYAPARYYLEKTDYTSIAAEPTINNTLVTPLAELTLGWNTDNQWFFEARGQYATVETDNTRYYGQNEYAGVGFSYLNGNRGLIIAAVRTFTHTDLRFDQYGLELIAGRTFTDGEASFSPFVGYWFKYIAQDYHLHWQSLTLMHLAESVDAMYNGLMGGFKASLLLDGWTLEAEAAVGMGQVHASYHGDQYVGNLTEHRDLEADTVAGMGSVEVGLSRPIGEDWKLGLNLGGQVLSYVPGIKSSSQHTNGPYGEPTLLEGSGSLSGKMGLELKYSF